MSEVSIGLGDLPESAAYFSNNDISHWWQPDRDVQRHVYTAIATEVGTVASRVDGVVLDLACGRGRGAEQMRRRMATLVCIDINYDMVAHCQRNIEEAFGVVGSAEQIPLSSCSVALISCTEALVHLSNISKVLCEMHRVLQPGGSLLISFDQRSALMRYLRLIVKLSTGVRAGRLRNQRCREIYRALPTRLVKRMLTSANFEIISTNYFGVLFPLRLSEKEAIPLDAQGRLDVVLRRMPLVRRTGAYVLIEARRA